MNPQEFVKLLNEARDLMTQEKYSEAMTILENLKDLEKNNKYDYSYNLIHQLYQLDSNCKSAYHQQRILENLKNIPINKKTISFDELSKLIRDIDNLNLSEDILKREVELLILRNLLGCKIEGDQLFFNRN